MAGSVLNGLCSGCFWNHPDRCFLFRQRWMSRPRAQETDPGWKYPLCVTICTEPSLSCLRSKPNPGPRGRSRFPESFSWGKNRFSRSGFRRSESRSKCANRQGMGREPHKSLTKTDSKDKEECPGLTISQGSVSKTLRQRQSSAPSSGKAARVGKKERGKPERTGKGRDTV